jgi:uncharacterized protein YjbI with pentapeptide repeats
MSLGWLFKHKWIVLTAFLAIAVLVGAGVWFWHVLDSYIDPKGPTGRKDLVQGFAYVVQVFALILAGIAGIIGAAVGLSNVRIARRNLEHNQEALRSQLVSQMQLEDKRAKDAALQSYFEHMGSLLTDHDLIGTGREDIRLLARAQTSTVLARLDGPGRGNLIRFLYGAGLIVGQDKPIVDLAGTDLSGVDLSGADLRKAQFGSVNLAGANLKDADLSMADLIHADLSDANLRNANLFGVGLSEADLSDADLSNTDLRSARLHQVDLRGSNLHNAHLQAASLVGANLRNANFVNADLSKAHLRGATIAGNELSACKSLARATMPNGQKYEDWLKTNKRNLGSR